MIESVWDYPRPPRVEASQRLVRVEFAGEVIAETTRAWRVLETSHPPVYYIPPVDVRSEFLRPNGRRTYCEFKGEARYYDLVVAGREVKEAAWYYPEPSSRYEAIREHLAFYPGRMDAAWVDDERVRPQEGGFYGGWITSEIEGPFKGAPGTGGW
jgi:uncharacterized protein (DUF427 family)